MASNHDWIWDV